MEPNSWPEFCLCGNRTVAALAEHICDLCKDLYIYCPKCSSKINEFEESE